MRSGGRVEAKGDRQFEDGPGFAESVAVELAELTHPVTDGLGVDEEIGCYRVAPALMQYPRTQRLGESVSGVGWQAGQRRQYPGA